MPEKGGKTLADFTLVLIKRSLLIVKTCSVGVYVFFASTAARKVVVYMTLVRSIALYHELFELPFDLSISLIFLLTSFLS